MTRWLATLGTMLLVLGGAESASADAIDAALRGKDRDAADAARDVYRHPRETLAFFGIESEMTIVELMPGGGWYTRLLAPLVREKGRYIGAEYDPTPYAEEYPDFAARLSKYPDSVKANPALYGENARGTWILRGEVAEDASVDMILGIRFLHNWISGGYAEKALTELHRTLKPGGVFAIVQHRAGEDDPRDAVEIAKSGYVKESYAIDLMKAHGFALAERSEINANPKDTRDHPEGVWTLPPALRLGDEDKEKYLAIGESDRMTLKFVKSK